MKKILLICTMAALVCGKCSEAHALNPLPDNYYSYEVECLETHDDIKSKCFEKFSLTVFVVCEGSDYAALGKAFDARPYKFNADPQGECYIKKNYNNASEILVMNENNARYFFESFGETPFIKKFEIFFVSNKNETCIKSMINMKSFIEKNIRPKYEFAKIGMLKYEIPKLEEKPKEEPKPEPKILILPRKTYPKHLCRMPSPLRQMFSCEKFFTEGIN